jgi:hypothetical protein
VTVLCDFGADKAGGGWGRLSGDLYKVGNGHLAYSPVLGLKLHLLLLSLPFMVNNSKKIKEFLSRSF